MKRTTLATLVSAYSALLCMGAQASVLEEVVITAQKKEQSLQDVGIAVTAFSGDQLDQLGFDSAQQITAMTPGVTTIQPNGPSSYFTSIRGVGQNDFSGDHQESPVAVYVDEVYISAASGAGFQLFDMERAEVLRGPQGTLFGRNATGGLVHYITRKPTQETEGYVEFTYGDYDQVKLEGAVGGGLTEKVSGRLSFVRNTHDGYVKNRIGTDLNNGDDWAIRGQLLFEINEDAEWLLNIRAGEQDIDTGFFEHSSARINPATGLGEDFNGADLQDVGDSLAPAFEETGNDVHEGAYNVIGFNKLETQGITSNLKWQFEHFELTAITDYFTLEKDYIEDSDASPNDYFAFFLQSDLDQFSQEIRLSGKTDSASWVTGFYYLDIEGDFKNGGIAQNFFAGQFPGFGLNDPSLNYLGLYNPFKTETESMAIFAQGDFDLTDTLKFTAGIRWSREKKNTDYQSYFALFETADRANVSTLNGLGGFLGPGDSIDYFTYNSNGAAAGGLGNAFGLTDVGSYTEIDDDLITAKLQLDWTPTDGTLVYVSYNRGIKAGGYNAPLDPTDLLDGNDANGSIKDMQFDEEVLDAYEVGVKTEFMDGLARLNTAVYYYDYQDYQAFRLEGLTQYVFNADAEVKGIDVELQMSPAEGWDVLLGLAYIDNVVEDAYQLPSGDTTDRRAVLTPEWNANAMVRYEWEAFDGMVAVQADATFLDEHYFQLKNSPVGKEDAYTLTNARVSYTSGDQSWTASAFVNNLTDEEYRTMVFDLAGSPAQAGFGLAENYYGLPRWWGVSLKYNWGG